MLYTKVKPPSVIVWTLAVFLLTALPATAAVDNPDKNQAYGAAEAREKAKQPKRWTTADHSKFKELQQVFHTGPEVTKACLSCHNEAGDQVQDTLHWTWRCQADPKGRMGKGGITLNNF